MPVNQILCLIIAYNTFPNHEGFKKSKAELKKKLEEQCPDVMDMIIYDVH